MSIPSPTRLSLGILTLLAASALSASPAVAQPYVHPRQVCAEPEVVPAQETPGGEDAGEEDELQKCRRRVKELEERILKLDTLSGQLKQAEEDLSRLKRETLRCRVELEEVAAQGQRDKADLERSRAVVADLTGRITECERDREKAVAAVASSQERAEQCERDLERAEEQLAALRPGQESDRARILGADWRWVAAAIGLTCLAILLLGALLYSRRRGKTPEPLDARLEHERDVRLIDEANLRAIAAEREAEDLRRAEGDLQAPPEEVRKVPSLYEGSPTVVPSPDDDSTEEVNGDVRWSTLLAPDSGRAWEHPERMTGSRL